MSTINWQLLGRSWKSVKPKLDPALTQLSSFTRNDIFFTPSLMHKMFGDVCQRNWYRRIEDLETLQVLHTPKVINDFGWIYSKNRCLSRLFKIDKQLLKNSGYSPVKKPKQLDVFEPEIKHTCFVVKDFYKYVNDPQSLAMLLMSKRTNVKFTDHEKTLQKKIDSWSDNLCGLVCAFDYKIFFDDEQTFNVDRFNYFIQELVNKCIKIPQRVQDEVRAYNELMTDESFQIVFRPRITIKWSATKVQVNIFCRGLSHFSNSHKANRQEWLDKLGLDVENKYDIVAAVPSVIRLINKGKWDNNDPRMMIVNSCNMNIPFNNLKKIIFKLIFTKSAANAWFHYNTVLTKTDRWMKLDRYIQKHGSNNIITTNKGERLNLNEHLTENDFEILYDETQQIIGPSVGVQVFYYETIIELLAMRILQQKGFTAVNVYDAIYANCSERQIKSAIKKAALQTLKIVKE